eukprot:5239763-Alexandrium_andersonii.AAC.1
MRGVKRWAPLARPTRPLEQGAYDCGGANSRASTRASVCVAVRSRLRMLVTDRVRVHVRVTARACALSLIHI